MWHGIFTPLTSYYTPMLWFSTNQRSFKITCSISSAPFYRPHLSHMSSTLLTNHIPHIVICNQSQASARTRGPAKESNRKLGQAEGIPGVHSWEGRAMRARGEGTTHGNGPCNLWIRHVDPGCVRGTIVQLGGVKSWDHSTTAEADQVDWGAGNATQWGRYHTRFALSSAFLNNLESSSSS